MCGIFGAVGQSISDAAVENVLSNLDHRGPDGRGVFRDPSVQLTFAHTRLTVIDLVTGAQPLESENGEIVLVCNGEVYDFERIRSSLEAKGYHFATKSNSEVIIYLYREFGLGSSSTCAANSRFYSTISRSACWSQGATGLKSSHSISRQLANSFVFASEMKAIFASGIVEPEINIAGLDPLLAFDPADVQFPFLGIEQVPRRPI